MRRLLIMSCSATKITQPATGVKARDRYDGPLWRTLRAADPNEEIARVAYLSALLGFGDANSFVDDYDAVMSEAIAKEMISREKFWRADAWKVCKRMFNENTEEAFGDVAIVGGKHYITVMQDLVELFKDGGAIKRLAPVTVINGKNGMMRKDLRAWLGVPLPAK